MNIVQGKRDHRLLLRKILKKKLCSTFPCTLYMSSCNTFLILIIQGVSGFNTKTYTAYSTSKNNYSLLHKLYSINISLNKY